MMFIIGYETIYSYAQGTLYVYGAVIRAVIMWIR
jgi:hypothetical protein